MGMATAATNCTSTFATGAETTMGADALASSNAVVAFIVGTMDNNVGAKRGGKIHIIGGAKTGTGRIKNEQTGNNYICFNCNIKLPMCSLTHSRKWTRPTLQRETTPVSLVM